MLDLKLLEEIVPDIEYKTYGDLQEIRLLTKEEVKDMARKNENDDLCQDDILNLCVTAICYMNQKQIVKPEDLFKIGKRSSYVEPTMYYESHGVDKCVPVTCESK